MPRPLSKRPRQLWDSAHLATSVAWLGVALCQLTLNIAATAQPQGTFPATVHQVAHLFDLAVLAPLAIGALVTGIVRATRSKWGLFQHWWVATKLVLTSVLFVADPLLLGTWNVEAEHLATHPAAGAEYTQLAHQLLAGSLANIAILGFMVVISVFKPWGRIRKPAPHTTRRPAA